MTLLFPGRGLLATIAIAGSMALACSPDIHSPISHVFVAPAWTTTEHMTYNLVEQGGEVYGTCELRTNPGSEPGKSQLSFLCADAGGNRDDRSAITDATTLQPFSATRTITRAEDNRRTTFTSTYAENAVEITATVDGKQKRAQRELPRPTPSSPDPGYYDDESLLWLVRGIPLHDGYRGAYKDINAGTGQVFSVEVSVGGQESVYVPAGAFSAWRVRIHTSSVTQYFWVEVEAPHRVVRAHVEHLVYELTGTGQ